MKLSLTAFLLIWGVFSSGCEKQQSDRKSIDMTSSQDGVPQFISEFDQNEAEIKNLRLTINDVEWFSYESNLITILDEFHIREITQHLPELVGIDEQIPASIDNLEAKLSISVTDSSGHKDMVILFIDKDYKLVQCEASTSVVNGIDTWLKEMRSTHDQIRKDTSNEKSSNPSDSATASAESLEKIGTVEIWAGQIKKLHLDGINKRNVLSPIYISTAKLISPTSELSPFSKACIDQLKPITGKTNYFIETYLYYDEAEDFPNGQLPQVGESWIFTCRRGIDGGLHLLSCARLEASSNPNTKKP